MTTLHRGEMWEDFVAVANMELAVIDESTTARAVERVRRLESARYRLTEGV